MRIWISRFLCFAVICVAHPCAAEDAVEVYKKLQQSFELSLEKDDLASQEKREEIVEKYSEALVKQENDSLASGDLAGVLEARKAKSALEASESIPDKELKSERVRKLGKVYRDSLLKIATARRAARQKKIDIYRGRLAGVIELLTKEAKIEEAVAAGEELKRLDKLAAEPMEGAQTLPDDPVRLIPIPTTRPAVERNPIDKKSWKDSMSFAEGRYELDESRKMGSHAGGQTFYLAKGGNYFGKGNRMHLRGGRLVAENCKFTEIRIEADHTGKCYFIDCSFIDSAIKEQGTWWGNRNYDAKFYFENSTIKNSFFSGDLNINHAGLCMSRCLVRDTQLPSIDFNEHEPVKRLKDAWLRVKACKFENCTVPLSFLYITSDCLFEDCRFVDDMNPNPVVTPIEITYFTRGCTGLFNRKPNVVKLIEKPHTQMNAPVGTFDR